jgi:uncharacterized protein DUF1638
MRVGVIACEILKLELEKLLQELAWEPDEILLLDKGLHVVPDKMREELIYRINGMAPSVDLVFLGYGICQSLERIEDQVSIPLIHPKVDDCICMMLGPDRFAEEIKKQVGTWFMTPGWAEVGLEMVIKELKFDRVSNIGKDPLEIAKMMFEHYKRCLFINTGVGNKNRNMKKTKEFASHFDLAVEETNSDLSLLRSYVEKARDMSLSKG